jgi:hypothetical protein
MSKENRCSFVSLYGKIYSLVVSRYFDQASIYLCYKILSQKKKKKDNKDCKQKEININTQQSDGKKKKQ